MERQLMAKRAELEQDIRLRGHIWAARQLAARAMRRADVEESAPRPPEAGQGEGSKAS